MSAGGEGGPAALAGVQLPADLRAWVSDPDGPKSYPIATYTWMLFYKENKDPKKAAALRALVEYCLNDGQKLSSQMGYIPLPRNRRGRGAEGARRASSERHRARARLATDVRSGSRPPTRWDLLRRPRVPRAWRRPACGWSCSCWADPAGRSAARPAVGIRDYGSASSPRPPGTSGAQQFGILPHIWGTLYSSLLALAIGGFFGVVMAIFLTAGLPAAARSAMVFRTVVELLAAIPSVVYGLWGLFVVVPALRPVAGWLLRHARLDSRSSAPR